MAKTTTHSDEALQYIDEELKELGIHVYRFCIENDCYVCNQSGNVYSVCARQLSKAGRLIEQYRIIKLKGSEDRYGYLTYRITVDGVKKHIKGHRLILNAWTEPHEDLCVNHKDGNKQNNSLGNLEWCTIAENNAHAIETGLLDPHKKNIKNRKIPCAEWMSIYILNKHCGISLSELGRKNGCSHDTIGKVVKRIENYMISRNSD